MISADDFDTLRSIARAGRDLPVIRELINATDWEIKHDDPRHSYLFVLVPDEIDKSYELIIGRLHPLREPHPFLRFRAFPPSEEYLEAFNATFHSAAEVIAQCVGTPTTGGERKLFFRKWSFAYYRWSLPEGEFTLVQDETSIKHDIEVTLWIQRVGTPLRETLNYHMTD